MNSALTKIFDTVLGALNLFRFWIVLNEYERGIILRLGKFHKDVGPGFHLRIPFMVDELKFVNTRLKTTNSWDMTFPLNGQSITMSFVAMIEVRDTKKVILNLDNWTTVAYALIKVALSQEVNRLLEEDPTSYLKTNKFTSKVANEVKYKLKEKGIHLSEFSFQEIAKTRAYKLFNGAG